MILKYLLLFLLHLELLVLALEHLLLLLQLHARHRPTTWPIVAAGVVIPIVLILVFIH